MHNGSDSFGRLRSKREVIDVQEIKPKDKSLNQLISVRKQRLERFERERIIAREAWRQSRRDLNDAKIAWRDALEAAKNFWQERRAEFFSMLITSGQFRRAKANYERMRDDAAQLHLVAREAVVPCKQSRKEFFDSIKRVIEANRDMEKLSILRDEIWCLGRQEEF
jgi:hypothetical protein